MRTMTLRDVQAHTGIESMSLDEAHKHVWRHQDRYVTAAQALALSMHTWNNTREDWLRLQACLVILKRVSRHVARPTLSRI